MNIYSNRLHWYQPNQIENKAYTCGFCENKVVSYIGLRSGAQSDGSGNSTGGIYLCPHCKAPTFINEYGEQIPGSSYGDKIKNLPEDVDNVYEESRSCYKNNNYTACVLLCRKLLMNISVNQGADEGLKFIEYIDYLSQKGFIPPNGKQWVDHIRQKGNEATHEIKIMSENEAKELLIFSEMLLKFIYEFPKMLPSK